MEGQTHYSVKCALISSFIDLELDFLVASRTAPGHSRINPVKRVMSILNLTLQNVAIAHEPTENMEGVLRYAGHQEGSFYTATLET